MLNEFDLKDYEPQPEVKLYEVPRNTVISVGDTFYFFKHVDGLYSFCYDLLKQQEKAGYWCS